MRGFTLIEMLVVIAIMSVVSLLMLANNTRFGGVVLLQNLAYDMALSIRQAQGYGIAVQRFNASFSYAYGMHFQVDTGGGSTYVLFADALAPEDGYYSCPQPGTANCELVQSTSIAAGYRVSQLCVTPPGGTERCDATSLDITFKRPEPDAYIRSSVTTGINESGEIHVMSPRGDTRVITVQANGQIAVE
jgi:prepilin-type N-terminal cleavage/methylation domain-containing protein